MYTIHNMFRLNILTRFLLRRFFSGVGLVMLIVCGIILAVTFVERLPSNPNAMAAEILNEALDLPSKMQQDDMTVLVCMVCKKSASVL